jgi:hypothetical protein
MTDGATMPALSEERLIDAAGAVVADRVRVPRRVFRHLLAETLSPERCVEAYHLHRIRLELVVERKIRRRQLTDDGNVEITGRDLRQRDASTSALQEVSRWAAR